MVEQAIAQHVGDGRVPALVSALAKLPPQTATGQARIGRHTLAQIRHERIDQPLARLSRAIDRRLQAAGDASANRLAVDPSSRAIAETVNPCR